MSLMPARRRASSIGLAGPHARQVPADRHSGTYAEFLRRHEVEAQQAARGTHQDCEQFARGLLPRAGDPRNVMLAIEHCASRGRAAGPNGLRPTDLDRQTRWELARQLSPLIQSGSYVPGPVRTVWISKGRGRGNRPIRIQDFQDRAVERAVLQVIRPLVQSQYLDCSFGYRSPGRSRERVIAHAERTAIDQNRWLWLSQDLKDAFEKVPRSRLLQIVRRMIPSDDIVNFLERLVAQDQRHGIRQGGCLSPELLNCYLHWFLDRWWKQQFPEVPMFRVADDFLALVHPSELEVIYPQLEQRCQSIGMPLKYRRSDCVHDLTAGNRVEWLGYSIGLRDGQIKVNLTDKAFEKLEEHLWLCWEDPFPTSSAWESILGWVGQYGAAYHRDETSKAHARITQIAHLQGFDEIPVREEIASRWYDAHIRNWVEVRRELSLGGDSGIAEGSADQHCDFATNFRRSGVGRFTAPLHQTPIRREVILYCDGSCLAPNGVGGWAFLMVEPETDWRFANAEGVSRTTNNRMELTAVIEGLASLPETANVRLVVDSEYVHKGITEWLPIWIANGWRAGRRRLRRLKNQDLWQRLAAELERHYVTSRWVRGHSGHDENEYVDRLAREAAERRCTRR